MPKNILQKHLSDSDLTEIQEHIAETEKSTSGEIRICFRMKRGWAEKKKTTRELAIKEFHKLGMHGTKDKTGVLVYILFGERTFEVVADAGINSKIGEDKWEVIKNHLSTEFGRGKYKEGLIKALDEIKGVLIEHFPVSEKDTNELSNDIVIK